MDRAPGRSDGRPNRLGAVRSTARHFPTPTHSTRAGRIHTETHANMPKADNKFGIEVDRYAR